MPTVNRMEIEGIMHDIEDTTARESALVPVVNSDNEITALTSSGGTSRELADTKARESVTGISDRLATAETAIGTLSETVGNLNTVNIFPVPVSAANTDILNPSMGFSVSVTTVGNLQLLSGGTVFKERGSKLNVKLLTLPVGYRPKWTVEGGAYTTGDNQPLRLWVDPDGSVYVFNNSETADGYIFIHAVYAKA